MKFLFVLLLVAIIVSKLNGFSDKVNTLNILESIGSIFSFKPFNLQSNLFVALQFSLYLIGLYF
jgi:hypothetical protein